MKAAAARKQPREDTVLATLNPPFRAEHIGSLLRPQSLLALREKLGRGEIDHAALAQAEDEAIREALALQERDRLEIRHRRRVPPPLVPQLLLPAARRSLHRHGGRRGRQGRQRGTARHPAGRDGRRAGCNGRSRSTSAISNSSGRTRASSRRSPSRARAPCTSAAAMRRCSKAPTAISTSSGTTRSTPSARSSRRWPRPAAATCRSTRPRSPSSAIPTCRHRSRRAATTGAR